MTADTLIQNERVIAMGLSNKDRLLFVAFTIRAQGSLRLIRVISARYTHKKERIAYEEIKKNIQED